MEGGEKEQEQDFHHRWLLTLALPHRRKQSLEGHKEKRPCKYLG